MFNMYKRFLLFLVHFTSHPHPHLWFSNRPSSTVQLDSLYALYVGSSDTSSILEILVKLQLDLTFSCPVFCFGMFFADVSSNLLGLVI